MVYLCDAYHKTAFGKLSRVHSLSEKICRHMLRITILKAHFSSKDSLPSKVVHHIYVFRPLRGHGVLQ
jgi:hypothetical protein